MKLFTAAISVVLFAAIYVNGQGTVTYVYDQQSATESTGGGVSGVIQANQPLGQSFTPALSSVGFIRLALDDAILNSMGATLIVNLRGGSITGSILGTSDAVSMPDGFSGYVDFFFSTPVSLTPGNQYYFQPTVTTGDASWTIRAYNAYGYTGGTAYANGVAFPGSDLWFREGIVVPEPTTAALVAVGLAGFALRRVKFT